MQIHFNAQNTNTISFSMIFHCFCGEVFTLTVNELLMNLKKKIIHYCVGMVKFTEPFFFGLNQLTG